MRLVRNVMSCIAVLALSAVVVASPAAAQAGEIDLAVALHGDALGVTTAGVARSLSLTVENLGSPVPASGVVVALTMPPGAQVLSAPASVCIPGTGMVICPIGDVFAFSGTIWQVPVRFDEVGPADVVATVAADQQDPDDTDNTATLSFVVVEETADLFVHDRRERALTGTTHTVSHLIWNEGPTYASGASVTGSFTGGIELVPGSLQGLHNVADECTLSETGFICDSVFHLPPGSGHEVSYDLVMPDDPATLESSITVSGRNDPDPSDNTGTVTLDVVTPRRSCAPISSSPVQCSPVNRPR